MEMPAAPGGGVRGPYVRGYYRLPQEDSPDARTWDNSHCQEARLESSSQSAPPPYTPSPQSSPHYSPDSQGSQYSPAPHTLPPPAPPSAPDFFISQQQSSNSAVIIGQQQPVPSYTTQPQNVPQDHLKFTICNLVLCFVLGNWVAFACLLPALILSLTAVNSNRHRNYDHARRSANISLCCNICVYIQYLTLFIIAMIFLAVYTTVGIDLTAH